MSDTLSGLLATAFTARADLLARLHSEQTNAYRVFHGSVEGRPGLTVDRYGDLLLAQSFHSPLSSEELDATKAYYRQVLPELTLVYNDRSQANSRIRNTLEGEALEAAMTPREAQEMGVYYRIQARHSGQDPWLFLDLRAGRRRVMQEAVDKNVLNLFAYTCGVGLAAAKAGAKHVVNVDFSETSLQIGRENSRLNDLAIRQRFIKSDAFAAMRQLAGVGQPTTVRGKRLPPFTKLEARRFDLVFLDPPRYAKSPFGVVDLITDYAALFKLALLCTEEGGTLMCTNNVAQVERAVWLDQIERCASKNGRTVRELEWITPEADFPSLDENPPLKMLLLRV